MSQAAVNLGLSVLQTWKTAALDDNPGGSADRQSGGRARRSRPPHVRAVHPFELVVGAAFHAYFNDIVARENISQPHHIEPCVRARALHCPSGHVCAESGREQLERQQVGKRCGRRPSLLQSALPSLEFQFPPPSAVRPLFSLSLSLSLSLCSTVRLRLPFRDDDAEAVPSLSLSINVAGAAPRRRRDWTE